MIQVTLHDNGIIYNRHAFYQYDYGQQLKIAGLDFTGGIEVHFARKGKSAIVKTVIVNDGSVVVDVPNDILTNDGELTVYICQNGKTYHSITFIIKPRPKPENYNPPEEETETLSMISPFSDKELLKELGMI